jgi:hypothetical protein
MFANMPSAPYDPTFSALINQKNPHVQIEAVHHASSGREAPAIIIKRI